MENLEIDIGFKGSFTESASRNASRVAVLRILSIRWKKALGRYRSQNIAFCGLRGVDQEKSGKVDTIRISHTRTMLTIDRPPCPSHATETVSTVETPAHAHMQNALRSSLGFGAPKRYHFLACPHHIAIASKDDWQNGLAAETFDVLKLIEVAPVALHVLSGPRFPPALVRIVLEQIQVILQVLFLRPFSVITSSAANLQEQEGEPLKRRQRARRGRARAEGKILPKRDRDWLGRESRADS